MNNAVFVKTIKKCEKTQSYLTCHKIKKKELFSINYCTKKFLTEHVLAMEMKKNKTKQNKKKKQKRTNTCQ